MRRPDLQRQIDALDAQVSDLQLNRPKNWEAVSKEEDVVEEEIQPT